MSFILDALKRNASDAETGTVPTLHTQASVVSVTQRRNWSGPLLFLSSLALLTALLGMLRPWQSAPADSVRNDAQSSSDTRSYRMLGAVDYQQYPRRQRLPQQPTPVASQPVDVVEQGTIASVVEAGEAVQDVPPKLKALFDKVVREAEPEPEVEPLAAADNQSLPELTVNPLAQVEPLTRKPLRFQDQIPPLRFQAHLYSSDPDKRWIKVNGEEKQEGDWLTQSLQLIAIESDKLILEQHGEPFSLPALTDW